MPLLDRFHREQQPRGWQVVGLAVDSPTPVREFLRQRAGRLCRSAWPAWTASSSARTLGNTTGGLPFTVVFDRSGPGPLAQARRPETGRPRGLGSIDPLRTTQAPKHLHCQLLASCDKARKVAAFVLQADARTPRVERFCSSHQASTRAMHSAPGHRLSIRLRSTQDDSSKMHSAAIDLESPLEREHGPSQAQDTDRPGVGIEHLRTGDHRSRRQGAHRQVRPGRAVPPMAAPLPRMPAAVGCRGRCGRRAGAPRRPAPRRPRPATSSSRRWSAPSTARPARAARRSSRSAAPVKEGEPICIIEAMKIMNEIEADKSGTITQDPVRERPGGRVRPAPVHHRVSRTRCSRRS